MQIQLVGTACGLRISTQLQLLDPVLSRNPLRFGRRALGVLEAMLRAGIMTTGGIGVRVKMGIMSDGSTLRMVSRLFRSPVSLRFLPVWVCFSVNASLRAFYVRPWAIFLSLGCMSFLHFSSLTSHSTLCFPAYPTVLL